VANQLARSAEIGDQAAVGTLRQAAQIVAHSDSHAGCRGFKQARVGAVATQGPGRGPLVAETVELLNRAARYAEAQRLAGADLWQFGL
jgi:hypothetical protein